MEPPTEDQLSSRIITANNLTQVAELLKDLDPFCSGILYITAGIIIDSPERQLEYVKLTTKFVLKGL
jgi:hypothetical protein